MTLAHHQDMVDRRRWRADLSMTAPDPGVTHILAPTDLRQESEQAIEHALHLARRYGAKLTLFHVWDIPEWAGATTGMLDHELMRTDRDRAEQAFYNLHNRIRARHLATDCFFLAGDPRALIVSAAKSLSTDLVVISTHYHNWLSELVGRSDTERIIRNAGCPVLVVS